MNILTAFQNFGLEPKRKTENEYSAPCPKCGGEDRCIIWITHSKGTGGRFYCRQCGINGDVIEFLQKFEGLNFQDACEKAGKAKSSLAERKHIYNRYNQINSFSARLEKPYLPPEQWRNMAAAFLESCQSDKSLLCKDAIMKLTTERFIPPAYARKIGIGWHEQEEYVNRSKWGLSENKKLRLPKGIVIATRRKIGIVNLTIRRIDKDEPKYWQVAGGAKDIPYIPQFKANLPIFILESALDAALLSYEAGKICNAIALGGTYKSIDEATKAFINAAPLIIASPDTDLAGNKARDHWQKIFPSAWVYRAAYAKDIGEMQRLAISENNQRVPTVGQWAAHAIEYCSQKPL